MQSRALTSAFRQLSVTSPRCLNVHSKRQVSPKAAEKTMSCKGEGVDGTELPASYPYIYTVYTDSCTEPLQAVIAPGSLAKHKPTETSTAGTSLCEG